MAYDPNDPNQASQGDLTQSGIDQQQSYDQLLQTIGADPDVQNALHTQGKDAAVQVMLQKYGRSGLIPGTSLNADGSVNVPPPSDKKAWETLALVVSIPAIAWGAGQVVGALGGAGAATPVADSTLASTGDAAATAGVDAGTTAAEASPGLVEGGSGAFDAAGNWVAGSTAANPATFAGTGGTFSQFANALGGKSSLVGAGLGLAGSALQAYESGKATDAQAAAAQQALALQAQIQNQNTALNVGQANQKSAAYNTALANEGPYRGIGNAAASMAGFSLGLPGYQQGNQYVVNAPPPSQPVSPLTTPTPIQVPGMPVQQQPVTAGLVGPNAPHQPMPTVGQQGIVNGIPAYYDGTGWKAQSTQTNSSVGAA